MDLKRNAQAGPPTLGHDSLLVTLPKSTGHDLHAQGMLCAASLVAAAAGLARDHDAGVVGVSRWCGVADVRQDAGYCPDAVPKD